MMEDRNEGMPDYRDQKRKDSSSARRSNKRGEGVYGDPSSYLEEKTPINNEVSSQQEPHQSRFNDAEEEEISRDHSVSRNSVRTKNRFDTEAVAQNSSKDVLGNENKNDDNEVQDIELVYCEHCEKSYAPATYKKFCQTLDENGVPKCIAMRNKKRRVYNSAKIRITSNSHLNSDEQRQVITSRKKVVSDLRDKAKGKKKSKKSSALWKKQSDDFRKAMETNRLITKAEKEGRPSHYYL